MDKLKSEAASCNERFERLESLVEKLSLNAYFISHTLNTCFVIF